MSSERAAQQMSRPATDPPSGSASRAPSSAGSRSRAGSRSGSRPPTCPDENELVLLADGALDDRRRAVIDRHLDHCAPCTMLVAELAGMTTPVRPVPKRYKIVRQLGAGAMGVVWEAEDTHLGRRVALKFVRPEGATDRERRARLFREARTLAQLRHPNVITVYDVGESGTELFMALELVIGMDARTWRAARERTPDEVLEVWRHAAAGVAAVHRAGVVHRDIKPDNVLVADDGRVLVGDFGLAALGDRGSALTQTGAIVGTPIYMAHEQLLGEPASQKSDQYALCASMWEALLGERPFTGSSLGAIAMAMLKPPKLPRRPDRHVFAVLARGLDPDPTKRWPDIDALVEAISAPARARVTSRRLAWLALGAAGIAAAATAAMLAIHTPSKKPPLPPPTASNATTSSPTVVATDVARPTATHEPAATDFVDTNKSATRRPTPTPTPTRPATATQGEWDLAVKRARDRLDHGDAAGCLRLLAAMPSPPLVMRAPVESLRAMCTMRAGDCMRGRAILEDLARLENWNDAQRTGTLEQADYAHCPLDAAPQSVWPARAQYRLALAAASKQSCKPVLAFIRKHDLQLPDRQSALVLESTCHANANDCAAARTSLRKLLVRDETEPARVAEIEKNADRSLVEMHPHCR